MAIISATSSITGLVGVQPGLLFINTTDSLATVTTAGYLTKAVEEQLISIQVPTTNHPRGTVAFVNTTNGTAVLSVSVTGVAPNLVYSLVEPTFAGGAIFAGNVQAGLSGTAGKFISFPPGAGLGTLQFAAANSAGNFNTIITNASQAGNRTYTVPDAGASSNFLMTNSGGTQTIATGNLALTVGSLVLGSSGHGATLTIFPSTAANGSFIISPVNNTGNFTTTLSSVTALGQSTIYTLPDPGASTTNIVLNTGVTTMAAGSRIILDKAAGTCVANAVTINKNSGVITTEVLTTAGGAQQAITLTNSLISASSVLLCQWNGGTNTTANITIVAAPGVGGAVITIVNNTAAIALNGTLIISFVVM
jgi:hypothetical protein